MSTDKQKYDVREISKIASTSDIDSKDLTPAMMLGCLQRIAQSTEEIAHLFSLQHSEAVQELDVRIQQLTTDIQEKRKQIDELHQLDQQQDQRIEELQQKLQELEQSTIHPIKIGVYITVTEPRFDWFFQRFSMLGLEHEVLEILETGGVSQPWGIPIYTNTVQEQIGLIWLNTTPIAEFREVDGAMKLIRFAAKIAEITEQDIQ